MTDRDAGIPPELGETMNRVGIAALAVAGADDARVLIYGEFSDDMEQLLFRHGPDGGSKLYCAEDVFEVMDGLRDAWELCRARGEKYRWRGVIYRIERGKMYVTLLYDEEVDESLTFYDKEERLLETYYPGVQVEPTAQDPPGSFRLVPFRRPPWWKFWR